MKIKTNRQIFKKIGVPIGALIFALSGTGYHILSHNQNAEAVSAAYSVTTTADSGPGSLRAAITASNANTTSASDPNKITFAIPGSGVQTISPTSQFPNITQPTIIDGTTQVGSTCGSLTPSFPAASNTPHGLNVQITQAISGPSIFTLTAAGSTIKGLIMNGPTGNAWLLTAAAPNATINCNYIGTDSTGTTAGPGNTNFGGINIGSGASNISIDNNLIAGLGRFGIYGGAAGMQISHNIIGPNHTGNTALTPNLAAGINLTGGSGLNLKQNIISGALSGDSILLNQSNANIVGNFMGIGLDGQTKLGKNTELVIQNGTGITVGTSAPVDRNVISSGGSGNISISNTTGLTVQNNYIGLAADGITDFSTNNGPGVLMMATPGAVIGGSGGNEGNVVTGNGPTSSGIYLQGNQSGTKIQGNIIGINADGTAPTRIQGNGIQLGGIAVTGDVTIGGTLAGSRNIISGNTNGIFQDQQVTNLSVLGNYIGVGIDGSTTFGDQTGIAMTGSYTNLMVGNGTPAGKNVIAPGSSNGIYFLYGMNGSTPDSAAIQGNYFGLTSSGQTAAATSIGTGIAFVYDSGDVTIGGANMGQGNVFGGLNNGIAFQRTAAGTTSILGNIIGLSPDGTTPSPNSNGINLSVGHSPSNPIIPIQVGGSQTGQGNIISGNTGYGILALGDSTGLEYAAISGNTIGADKNAAPQPNASGGININGSNFIIGGSTAVAGNTISNNQGDGIAISGTTTGGNTISHNTIKNNNGSGISINGSSATQNTISQNTIKNNTTTGISLLNSGNNTQAAPVISPSLTSCDGTITTAGASFLQSAASTTYTIEYFSNPAWTITQPLEGEQYISSEIVTTDANGHADLSVPSAAINPSATATDPSGNTSAFSTSGIDSFSSCQLSPQQTTDGTLDNLTFNGSWTASGFAPSGTNQTGPLQISTVTVGGRPYDVSSIQSQYMDGTSFSFSGGTVSQALAIGTYDVTITFKDTANGITMTHTFANAVTIIPPPPAPSVTLQTLITNQTTPLLSGTASNIDVYDGIYLNICPVSSPMQCFSQVNWYRYPDALYSGVWQLDPNDGNGGVDGQNNLPGGSGNYGPMVLPEGTYNVSANYYAMDGTSYTKDFPGILTVDTTAPTGTIVTPAPSQNLAIVVLSGTVDDPTATVKVSVGGKDYTATNNGDGTWDLPAGSITSITTAGTYPVTVTFADAASNHTQAASSLSVNVPPTVDTTTWVGGRPILHGRFDSVNTSRLRLLLAGRYYTLGSSPELTAVGGLWTLDLSGLVDPLSTGRYTVTAEVQTLGGQVLQSTTTNQLTIIPVTPISVITSPTNSPLAATGMNVYKYGVVAAGTLLIGMTVLVVMLWRRQLAVRR